ncbi:SpoIIE family protein phosphatase [Flammeovirga yaeyamensis]|uniref:SpoIIE family protein phosphatase n=1 Tax=Flammeovirga yaeyamensis TaxID=367791 RepID=A0AAX1N2H7_9BACT|nr:MULTISPECIES: SpoIIE family protein phosphatase [Flammeovirga]ANQ51085.1 SpoIIE family protein phosphatase [Flammeovirga sp. MY04]MBB3698112.1 ligand-binding sensor domain-containing protein/serine phosphatase RsbU (regulator of sigma subunit) [Flammeovirga yaeyamensis]NMF34529.1 SpoIIE family protein phosphatase [Flammeovirga yaeyamensis]QWG01506.1 SpoIIE family protein phosphatase [Flammeovirga yaeyamensis]
MKKYYNIINYFTSFLLLSVVIGISNPISAQNILSTHYSKDDGLKADYIKNIAKDSIGYLWIASDNGLIRYDGSEFLSLGTKKLESQYIKQVFQKKDGSLYAISNKEIVQIYSKPNGVYWNFLLKMESEEQVPGKLHYGKLLYEDRDNVLWAADNNQIFRQNENNKFEVKLTDFTLPAENENRSFQLVENANGDLYAFHYSGHVYRFDVEKDKFVLVSKKVGKLKNIQHAIWYTESAFLVADSDRGVSLVDVTNDKVKVDQIGRQFDASFIQEIGTDQYLVTGFVSGMYRLETTFKGFKLFRDPELGVYNGNTIYYNDLDIWLAKDNGISLFQQLPFNVFANNLSTSYIQHISGDDDNIYFSDGNNFFNGTINTLNQFTLNHKITTGNGNSFLRILPTKEGVYTSDANGIIQLWRNGKEVKKIDMSNVGGAIYILEQDKDGYLWTCQDGVVGAIKIGKDNKPIIYGIENGISSRPIVIKIDDKGEIFVGGTAKDGLIYQYDKRNDIFKNLTPEIKFRIDNNIQTNDIATLSTGEIILATSYGTLLLKDEKFKRLNFGDYTSVTNNALGIDPSEKQLWVATSNELIRYNFEVEEYLIYNNKDGLPDANFNIRGLFIDAYGRLFISTTRGIGFAPNLQVLKETPRPIVKKISAGGDDIPLNKSLEVPSDSYLRLDYHISVYPTENVVFQRRILGYPGKDEWMNFDKEKEGLLISELESGTYTLEIRGRKTGNFSWSRPLSQRFSVYTPFYKQWWSYLIYLGVTIFVIVVTIQINRYRSRREQRRLEEQVNIRTKEVEMQSNELSEKNYELEKAFNRLKRSEAILNHNTKELERAKKDAEKAASKLKDQNNQLEETTRTIREQHHEMKSHREQILRQNELVKEQALLLSQHNEKVKSSVNYARRMQTAVFGRPSDMEDKMQSIGPHWDGFVYLKPRDIVSGDFHWFGEKNENYIIVASDCTGHGVPGAFMSLIGNDLLNQIVYERGILDPGRILKLMNDMIRQALNQAENDDSRDGMDIAVCVVSPKRKTLTFAGAGRPLYYVDKTNPSELQRLKGGKFGVGGKKNQKKVYDSFSLPLENIEVFYICSDGYQDQFGGPSGRKLMQRPFKELLYNVHKKDMNIQREAISKFMEQWMREGNQRQIDDMLVIGVRPHVIVDEIEEEQLQIQDESKIERHTIF